MLLAPPVEAVIAAQLLTVIINFAEHANAVLPESWERRLRALIVTPQIHRIHHSDVHANEQSNFGELFPWWDRMFGTFRGKPEGGTLTVGLRGYQDERSMGFVSPRLVRAALRKAVTSDKASS